jgi:hypothetical protein
MKYVLGNWQITSGEPTVGSRRHVGPILVQLRKWKSNGIQEGVNY